jgi:hypothetical protein
LGPQSIRSHPSRCKNWRGHSPQAPHQPPCSSVTPWNFQFQDVNRKNN